MPTYSFGKDSPLKIKISRKDADAYNRFTKAFFEAQTQYKESHGVRWTPDQPLPIKTTRKDNEIYNRVGRIINEAIKNFGRGISEDELMEDYLIKN
jgi:hypothetical protein